MSKNKDMSQGSKANYNGKKLEKYVKKVLTSGGSRVVTFKEAMERPEVYLNDKELVIRNAPFVSVYGRESFTEFSYLRKSETGCPVTRIEVKNQETAGSADEKFPYLIENALHGYPEKEIVFVVNAPGAKAGAVDYLKRRAKGKDIAEAGKTVYVLSPEEFAEWFAAKTA